MPRPLRIELSASLYMLPHGENIAYGYAPAQAVRTVWGGYAKRRTAREPPLRPRAQGSLTRQVRSEAGLNAGVQIGPEWGFRVSRNTCQTQYMADLGESKFDDTEIKRLCRICKSSLI